MHCRTGRGRTGVVICAYLLYAKLASTADDALLLFATKRAHNVKGVTNPSQVRAVHYFERLLKEYRWMDRPFPDNTVLSLHHVRITTVPQLNATGGCDLYFVAFGAYPYKPLFYDHLKAQNGKIQGFHEKTLTHCDLPVGVRALSLSLSLSLSLFFLIPAICLVLAL